MYDRLKGLLAGDRCPTEEEMAIALKKYGQEHQSLDHPFVEVTIHVVLDGPKCHWNHKLLVAETRPKPAVL